VTRWISRGWLRTVTLDQAKEFHRRNAARPSSGHEETIQRVAVAGKVDLFMAMLHCADG